MLTNDGACWLTKTGRRHFYSAYSLQLPNWREELRRLAIRWAKWLDNRS